MSDPDRTALVTANLRAHEHPNRPTADLEALTEETAAEIVADESVQTWSTDELRRLATLPDFSFWSMATALGFAEGLGPWSSETFARLTVLVELDAILASDDQPDPVAVFSFDATLLLCGVDELGAKIERVRRLAAVLDLDLLELINEAAEERDFHQDHQGDLHEYIACSRCHRVGRCDRMELGDDGLCNRCASKASVG